MATNTSTTTDEEDSLSRFMTMVALSQQVQSLLAPHSFPMKTMTLMDALADIMLSLGPATCPAMEQLRDDYLTQHFADIRGIIKTKEEMQLGLKVGDDNDESRTIVESLLLVGKRS